MSRAEDILDRLEKGGTAAVDEFIHTRKSEELFLDFKRSADAGAGKRLHVNDRSNLGRALSGFANSEGGVIVWGIDCRPGEQHGADVARFRFPLSDCAAFASWLEGAVSGCTVPPCPGVRSLAIRDAEGPTGFVATYIPKSARAPHRCLPDNQYLIRAGSAFLPAPHGVLAGLFGQRPEPFVYHRFMVKPVHCSTSSDIEATVALIIESDGPGIARDIFVIFDILHPGGPSMLELRAPNTAAFDIFPLMGFHTAFVAKDSFKLPPGGRIQVCSLYLRFIPPFEQRLYLHMNYGCAGAPTRQHSLRHTPDTLEEICRSTAALPENKQTDSFMSKVFGEPGLLPERVPTLKER